GVRQVATPWPYCAPTTKAPFLYLGMTTTQEAPARMELGMPLSGVAMICSITSAEELSRSLSVPMSAAWAGRKPASRREPQSVARTFFIEMPFQVGGRVRPSCRYRLPVFSLVNFSRAFRFVLIDGF